MNTTLAALFNSAAEFEFEGTIYRLRLPVQGEKGEYQAWLEQRALDGILREKAPPDIIDRQLKMLTQDKVKGVYAFGGDVCCDTLTSEEGLAKYLAIVLRDQGVTLETARRMAEREFRRIVYALFPQETEEQKNGRRSRERSRLEWEHFLIRLKNPPFSVPFAELERMSDEQVLALFDHEREEDGAPKLTIPSGRKPTSRYLHERRCFDLGITEPEDVERLWREKLAQQPPEEHKKHVRRRPPRPDRTGQRPRR